MEFVTWKQNVLTGGAWTGNGADAKYLIKPEHTEPEPSWRNTERAGNEFVCKILTRRCAAVASKVTSPPWFGIALVVGKWGPTVNLDLNAKALPQCSEQVDRAGQWWNITASLGLWVRADSSPSCGFPVTRTCLSPLVLALPCAFKEKEPQLSAVA